MNIAEPFLRQAKHQGEAVAIIEPTSRGDRTITFDDLERASSEIACWLKHKGLKPGNRVLVMIGISIDLYIALIALLRLGLVAEFLDPSAGRDHVRRCCKVAPPAVLLGPMKAQLLRVAYSGLRRVRSMVYPRPFGLAIRNASDDRLANCTAQSPALLTFTSGSTAEPKAAVRTHGLLSAQQAALAEAIDLQPGQVDLATLPVFVLANLAAGVTTVLADADLRRPGFIKPDPVLEQISTHRVTRSTGSPAFYQRLVERCEQSGQTLAPLQRVYTGGAPVFPDLLARLDAQLPDGGPITVYGSTEAEPISHVAYDQIAPEDFKTMGSGGGLLVGQPVRQIELLIANPKQLKADRMTQEELESALCRTDEPGEILVTGDHVLKGYLNPADDIETKLHIDETTWHRSGDAGRLDDRGRLWLLGRTSAVIDDGRGTLYPFAVECAARQVSGVAQAAVAAVEGRRILAIETSPGVDQKRTTTTLSERFDAIIDDVVVLAQIPLDARHNAKVRYPELRRVLLEQMPLCNTSQGDTRAD